MAEEPLEFKTWAIVELLGHVRIAGLLTEEERFGAKIGRIDIPVNDTFVTQYFGHSSIYRITPCTEEVARSVAFQNQPQPIYPFELPEYISDEDEPVTDLTLTNEPVSEQGW